MVRCENPRGWHWLYCCWLERYCCIIYSSSMEMESLTTCSCHYCREERRNIHHASRFERSETKRIHTHIQGHTHTHTHLCSPVLVATHGAQQPIVRAKAQRRYPSPMSNEMCRALAAAAAVAATPTVDPSSTTAGPATCCTVAERGCVPETNDAIPACGETEGVSQSGGGRVSALDP